MRSTKTVVGGGQSDERVTIESTVVGTLESIDLDNLTIVTITGVKLDCALPSDETVDIGDLVRVIASCWGYSGKNEWISAEVIFDKVFI